MKKLALAAFAATLLTCVAPFASVAVAEGIGISIGTGDNDRGRLRRGDNDENVVVRRRNVVRERDHDQLHTGAVGCKTVIIRETNDDGDTVTKKIKKCN